ncbi:hypothetical protein Bbelb_328010 [Branchiostoma belcheri]|nr:hypothetical protein Bbelb_328010 [Branchiostoma belcheri]
MDVTRETAPNASETGVFSRIQNRAWCKSTFLDTRRLSRTVSDPNPNLFRHIQNWIGTVLCTIAGDGPLTAGRPFCGNTDRRIRQKREKNWPRESGRGEVVSFPCAASQTYKAAKLPWQIFSYNTDIASVVSLVETTANRRAAFMNDPSAGILRYPNSSPPLGRPAFVHLYAGGVLQPACGEVIDFWSH